MNKQLILEIIVVAIPVISLLIWVAWQIKKRGLKEVAIDMILLAEDLYQKGQNSEKMQFVVERVQTVLLTTTVGRVLAIFVTNENIEKFIQKIFDNLKKALDYTPNK